ncbi:aminotransferase class I/II-fold pyridoxal phosphate-dependent enzyme [Streptomyces sp. N2-109]|uniref:Aminotransferase class I/II-fold pyridoxal phosphate-dependent enzyme n=1 Tax=Streptomyces gossypii TaxID=2883101 RepID=A0ABT2JPE7_9ACTN|nr:aminotransferase class I/II-fold pyridoxal phosphate-dependent enzyme [Streptomyces gossypii]MCT2589149.1 aminotransferase class I/II-fold pyridoxal phosphate-dependent enzyme [Streptomyces gossypii]
MATSHASPPPFGASELDKFSAYRATEATEHANTEEILDLSNNELMLPPLPTVAESLRETNLQVNLYPDPAARFLSTNLARHFGAAREETVVGPGSGGVLAQLLLVLAGKGDEVLYAWPGFDAYPLLIAVTGATGVAVPLTSTGEHDLAGLLAQVNPRTRAVILCSPHNPTGRRIARSDLSWFLERLPPHVVTILDQAYMEFDEEDDPHDLELIRSYPGVVLLRTFSKAYGLAGLRVGYAFASSEIARRARKTVIPFSVTQAGERAAVVSMAQEKELAERLALVRRLRADLERDLGAQGLTPTASSGNFVWLPLGESSDRFAAAALRAGVRVRSYSGDGVRISVGTQETHRRVLLAARSFVSETVPQSATEPVSAEAPV